MALIAFVAPQASSAATGETNAAWQLLAAHFQPPPESAGQLGECRSPLRFDDGSPVKSAADWPGRREEILQTWNGLMGPWPPVIERPKVEVLREEKRDGLTWRRVRLEIAPQQTGEGWLLVPEGKGPFPAVLVVYYEPETSVGLKPDQPLRDFGLQLAKRGFVTLSIGTPGGDARQPDIGAALCQPLSFHAYVAANCWHALADLPYVDRARIGVTGHSYGGKWAMFAAALWDKFAAVAVSDPGIVFDESRPNVNYWEPWYLGLDAQEKRPKAGVPTADNPRTGAYKKMIEQGRDLHELHALIAPRPFLVSGGSEDPPSRWLALNHLVEINKLLGFTNRVAMTNRKDHTPNEQSNAQLYAFFEHFLKDGAQRRPRAEGPSSPAAPSPRAGVQFNTAFEGASLGKVVVLSETAFRVHVEGQHDERGRNRQANWYYFRMDGVKDREITLTLTDFVGEYNDKPGACPMNAGTLPVFSSDDEHWQHFATMEWDDQQKEATLKFRPTRDRIWIAHVPPYTHSRLLRLLGELDRQPHVTVEVIGKTVLGRDLHLVTITNPLAPDADKQCVWFQARQHAWETGTSWAMEGALRFIASDDAAARALRDKVLFKFTPMLDPDGCALGKVRFNAHGFDVNRHWHEVDLRDKQWLQRCPEIWYAKKAIFAQMNSPNPIDLLLNMHNDEDPEYLETQIDSEAGRALVTRFFERLVATTSFDPSRPPTFNPEPTSTSNDLWRQQRVPIVLMEQRIAPSKKLGRQPTVEDWLTFGRQLISFLWTLDFEL